MTIEAGAISSMAADYWVEQRGKIDDESILITDKSQIGSKGKLSDWGFTIEPWQRDEHGRVRFASDGTQLPGYRVDADPETEGVQRWQGDWTTVPYEQGLLEAMTRGRQGEGDNDWSGVRSWLSYLCQRTLDLLAPNNPTLTETQKAELWGMLIEKKDGLGDNVARPVAFVSRYVNAGNPIQGWGFGGGGDNNNLIAIAQHFAKRLSEIEKQANLPNAEARKSNLMFSTIKNAPEERREAERKAREEGGPPPPKESWMMNGTIVSWIFYRG
jgi:hypothetical protein